MDLVLDWPAVDDRRARLAEGWCPAQGHPPLASPDGSATCPRCGLVWRLSDGAVTVSLPD